MIVVVTVEGFHMSEERDETGLVRAACWQLCDAKNSYSCAILCKGWGCVVELWGEGDKGDGKESVGVVDEGIANVIIDGTVTFRARWLVAAQRANAVLPRTRFALQTVNLSHTKILHNRRDSYA